MANVSVTYSFTNGTTADADEVNTNFTDIINGTSDGTKDFSINALTCAGAVTLNGAVTLGNASSDDLTFNGAIASSIPVKTTATYNIGGSTTGLAGIYFGANSQTTRIINSASASATYTLTLPPSAGSAYQVLRSGSTSGTTTFGEIWPTAASAPSTTQTLTISSAPVQVYTPTASITVKLDNSFIAGRVVTIVNKATAYDITVTANDDTTICTIYRATRNQIICDSDTPTTNTSWSVLNRVVSPWIIQTTGFAPTAGFGTISGQNYAWKRDGKNMIGDLLWTNGTVAASVAAVDLPSGLTFDFANTYSTGLQAHKIGTLHNLHTGSDTFVLSDSRAGTIHIDDADTNRMYACRYINNNRFENVNGNTLFNSSAKVVWQFTASIAEWGDFSG